jgi:hypothetical protein
MFHTHVASVCAKCFICFKCMLHSSVSRCKCSSAGVHEGGQDQAVATNARKKQAAAGCVGSRQAVVEESGASLPDGLEETEASHPSSVGSGSEVGGSDASAANGAGVGGARIRADRAEQPRESGHPSAQQEGFYFLYFKL